MPGQDFDRSAPKRGDGRGRNARQGGGRRRPGPPPRGKQQRQPRQQRQQEREGGDQRPQRRGSEDDPGGRGRNRGWGGVARRGAASGGSGQGPDDRERDKGARGKGAPAKGRAADADREPEPATVWEPEQWIDEGAVRDEAERAVGRGSGGRRHSRGAPDTRSGRSERNGGPDARGDGATREELRHAVGPDRAERFARRLESAGETFRRGRFDDARRTLRPLAESAPDVAAVRELYGLTLYRLGRWKQAARELETFRTLTGETDQHPVLADCYRALRRYDQVEELWAELKAASPRAALVAEGRIVAAGALADQGRVEDGIRLLEPGLRPARKAREHDLRVAYALADLYERAGDLPRARELFQRVAASDPDFVDVGDRLRALG